LKIIIIIIIIVVVVVSFMQGNHTHISETKNVPRGYVVHLLLLLLLLAPSLLKLPCAVFFI